MKKIKKSVSKLNKFFISIVVVTLLGLSYFLLIPSKTLSDSKIDILSQRVLRECQNEDYKPLCYENEIYNLAQKTSMEDAFKLTRSVQEKDPSYAYCHVLAHKITFLEAKRKPGQWKDILTRCPVDMCNYGCLHGSLIEHFKGEVLTDSQIDSAISDLQSVCEERVGFKPTPLDQNMCYHAIGHLGMYITGGNPQKSSDICKKVAIKDDGRDFYETCVEGVFMTIYQGVDEEDIALVAKIKPKKEDVRKFCDIYQGVDYEACNRESYPLFVDELKSPGFAEEFCSYARDDHGQWKCYATIVSNLTVDLMEASNLSSIDQFCLKFPDGRRENCFANAAVRIVQNEPKRLSEALSVCELASRHKIEKACYTDMITFLYTSTQPGSPAIDTSCRQLPGYWIDPCLQRKNNR